MLEHPALGRIEIPTEKIKLPMPRPGLFGTSFLAGWKRTFQLGVSGGEGNSKTSDVLAALGFGYVDEERRWAFDAAYRFGAAEGFTNRFFPALNDLGEYRNLSSFAWKWKLLDEPGLSLIAGVDNEYQSSVETGLKHDDLKYSTSIGIDF